MRIKKKYFLDEEFWETIRPDSVFKGSKPVHKEYQYKCSDSLYSGDWVGGFRHGKGTMKWTDGATYEGLWEMGRAYG
jgi:hypothetical protein